MFVGLEFNTMLIMSGLIAIVLSGLLYAIHHRTVAFKGLGYWVSANFFTGAAIIVFTQRYISLELRASLGGLLMVVGFGLYFLLIDLLERRLLTKKATLLLLVTLILSNIAILFFTENEYIAVVFNTLVIILLSIACGIYLLFYSVDQQSSEHRLTGYFFILFAALSTHRFAVMCFNGVEPVENLINWPYNEITFLACILSILAVNFGFIAIGNKKTSSLMAHTAEHDWLTGAMNRGSLEKGAELLASRSRKTKQSQAMVLLDLDHFKQINDTYGHLFGDKVIQTFVQLARDSMRDVDLLGRYGGEEFCILMPNSNEQDALILAERIRLKLESCIISNQDSLTDNKIRCTVSAGTCDSNHVGSDFKMMFSAADKALYAAKKAGRNKVIQFSSLSC